MDLDAASGVGMHVDDEVHQAVDASHKLHDIESTVMVHVHSDGWTAVAVSGYRRGHTDDLKHERLTARRAVQCGCASNACRRTEATAVQPHK